MKTSLNSAGQFLHHKVWSASRCGLLLACALIVPLAGRAADALRTFATPAEAASALAAGVKTQDRAALHSIFGPALEEIENPDRVQATNEFHAFAAALDETFRLNRDSATHYTLELGTNRWPFPIPIVLQAGRWSFDTAAGTEELLNRRIGKNELAALEVVRAYVDAQREYASRDRDGDMVLEFAQKLSSAPGKRDGLYWPAEDDDDISPLGPFVANAQGEGYELSRRGHQAPPEPYHGYYFKILKRQGSSAPGGKYKYVINGHMIGGFALVAWPAEWGQSGIMTFIVNQQGLVYQKDLGPKTSRRAPDIDTYDPDNTWTLSPN